MNETTITVTGNVATPPEHKVTSAGVSLTKFRLASTERRWDRESASWIDVHTSWYAVSLWRGLADHAHRSLNKGDRVILTGRLRLKSWDNGTRQGTDAEIEADAIGHDLRWGTTSFARSGRAAATAEAPAEARSGEPAIDGSRTPPDPSPHGAWAVPGDDRELELASADTPF